MLVFGSNYNHPTSSSSSRTRAVRILTCSNGLSSAPVFTRPILCTTLNPLFTLPNIVCLPSSQGVGAKVMLHHCQQLPCSAGPSTERTRIGYHWYSARCLPYSGFRPQYALAKGVSRPRIFRRRWSCHLDLCRWDRQFEA